jgi:hypothetical protein
MTGDRNDEKIDERKVRRYWRKMPKTRPMVDAGWASDGGHGRPT